MDRSPDALSLRAEWLPRVSGDGPFGISRRSYPGEVAPCERGWTLG